MQDGQLHYRYENAEVGIKLEHYVYRIGSYHYNWHNDFELLVIMEGSVEVCASGSRFVLDEDDMILINPNEGHASLGLGQGNTAMALHFDPGFFQRYFGKDEFASLRLVTDARTRDMARFAVIRRCLAQMMVLSTRRDPASRLRFDAVFFRLMTAMVPDPPQAGEGAGTCRIDRRGNDAANSLVAYVEKNYRRRITLADLSRQTGYNTSYISQLFKSKLGINFSEYLTRVRLASATAELSSGDARVSDIAVTHGFADLKAFNTAFKKTFGKSPSEYRRQLSDENRASDTAFKQVFVPADDEYIGSKLARYVLEGAGKNVADGVACEPAVDAGEIQRLARSLEDVRTLLDDALSAARSLA